jgi:GH24 family phage-related lysozyme (muramidase)
MIKNKLELILENAYKEIELNEATKPYLLVTDIQPEYQEGFTFRIEKFTQWLNRNFKRFSGVTFLYNGADTLGMISEDDLKMWYFENGLKEYIIENVDWYDKGYAFFRYCIDKGIDEDDIVLLVKFMATHNINDSRDITSSELWDKFVGEYNKHELREIMEFADDCINIPDLMDYLRKKQAPFLLLGGGKNECLKEVEIALKSNGQQYTRKEEWIYEGKMKNIGLGALALAGLAGFGSFGATNLKEPSNQPISNIQHIVTPKLPKVTDVPKYDMTPVTYAEITDFIKYNEGNRSRSYKDTKNNKTIGVGFNLQSPGAREKIASIGLDYEKIASGKQKLTQKQIDSLFKISMKETIRFAKKAIRENCGREIETFPKMIQLIIYDMEYNMGPKGFRKLEGLFSCLQINNFDGLANYLEGTEWYKDVGNRSKKIIDMIRKLK